MVGGEIYFRGPIQGYSEGVKLLDLTEQTGMAQDEYETVS